MRRKMNPESKRALIAAGRKVVFAGLILLVVWLILFALRSAIPANIIDLINQRLQVPVSHDSASWDWSRSLLKDSSVSSIIGERLGNTLAFIALCGIMSLMIAGILLFIGTLISRITQSPGWLAKLRGILRSILISGGASIPLFVISTLLIVSFTNSWQPPMQGNSVRGTGMGGIPLRILAGLVTGADRAWNNSKSGKVISPVLNWHKRSVSGFSSDYSNW